MKYIRLKLKTKEEILELRPSLFERRISPDSEDWGIGRICRNYTSRLGKDITEELDTLYTSFNDIPQNIEFYGYKIDKRYLTPILGEKKEVHKFKNGLLKFK